MDLVYAVIKCRNEEDLHNIINLAESVQVPSDITFWDDVLKSETLDIRNSRPRIYKLDVLIPILTKSIPMSSIYRGGRLYIPVRGSRSVPVFSDSTCIINVMCNIVHKTGTLDDSLVNSLYEQLDVSDSLMFKPLRDAGMPDYLLSSVCTYILDRIDRDMDDQIKVLSTHIDRMYELPLDNINAMTTVYGMRELVLEQYGL